jgi:hypothetical protein
MKDEISQYETSTSTFNAKPFSDFFSVCARHVIQLNFFLALQQAFLSSNLPPFLFLIMGKRGKISGRFSVC